MGPVFWNELSFLDVESLLFFTLSVDLDMQGAEFCKNRFKHVAERLYTAAYQFERNHRQQNVWPLDSGSLPRRPRKRRLPAAGPGRTQYPRRLAAVFSPAVPPGLGY